MSPELPADDNLLDLPPFEEGPGFAHASSEFLLDLPDLQDVSSKETSATSSTRAEDAKETEPDWKIAATHAHNVSEFAEALASTRDVETAPYRKALALAATSIGQPVNVQKKVDRAIADLPPGDVAENLKRVTTILGFPDTEDYQRACEILGASFDSEFPEEAEQKRIEHEAAMTQERIKEAVAAEASTDIKKAKDIYGELSQQGSVQGVVDFMKRHNVRCFERSSTALSWAKYNGATFNPVGIGSMVGIPVGNTGGYWIFPVPESMPSYLPDDPNRDRFKSGPGSNETEPIVVYPHPDGTLLNVDQELMSIANKSR